MVILPTLMDEAKKNFNWDAVGNAKQYQTRSMKRVKRRRLNNEHEIRKKDPGERASKIWE